MEKDKSNQWVKGGNCRKCRRVCYCRGACKQAIRRRKNPLLKLFDSVYFMIKRM